MFVLLVSRRRRVWRDSVVLQAEGGIRDLVRSRGLGDGYKRQGQCRLERGVGHRIEGEDRAAREHEGARAGADRHNLSLIHI